MIASMHILLINTNRMRPPIAPVGLDYVGAALRAEGHEVDLLDLCFEASPLAAIDACMAKADYGLIGLSFRNTDDCYYPGRCWFLPELLQLVERIRAASGATIVLGGVGFSILPEAILRATGADGGIVGEGEFAMCQLARELTHRPRDSRPAGVSDVATSEEQPAIPGVLWQCGGRVHGLPPQPGDLAALPPMRRDLVDNERYYREGGQLGFETKRGCGAACIYCADPVAKGRSVRVRPPEAIADELGVLADRGLTHLHTCDAEFNRPVAHALAVCEAIRMRGLGSRLRWFAYCAPTPFPPELATAMRAAGCVGVNFGADSGDEQMLRGLGRDFSPEDIRTGVELCRREGMACMLDLLLGGPGETAGSVERSLSFAREVSPDRVGLSVGVRIYQGTKLARLAQQERDALHGPGAADGDFVRPAFYFAPELGLKIFPFVSSLVDGDQRFFFSDPTAADRNYNYSDNDVLVDAIARGHRGAYWDILRRLQDGLGPA
jgi:tryptophan 2-C-methyltransferase